MILFDGVLYESSKQNELLGKLKDIIPGILCREPLPVNAVTDAIAKLREDTLEGKFDHLLTDLPEDTVASYKEQAAVLLSKEQLQAKVRTELGDTSDYITEGADGFSRILFKTMPLGVLLHIAAGTWIFFRRTLLRKAFLRETSIS